MTLSGKSVLITGGTGSFGQKFTEIAVRDYSPRRLVVFSRDELKQQEMAERFDDPHIRFFIGDVRDLDRLRRAMQNVDIVVHAAALKQVPACEYNPFEAVKTNVFGAQNVVDAAIDCGVERVIAISTDKAVNPVNLYGATKLCAEKMIVQGNAYSGGGGTRFSCCSYGNVVGSRGSVVPLFLRQRKNGTVTVTDPRMTRFWITLEQGVRFVIERISDMRGGEIFVPKIPSIRIMDLVKALAPTCGVQEIGIRPGEKLHEALVSEDEASHTLEHEGMYVVHPTHPWWSVENGSGGIALEDGFRYGSDTNSQWVAAEELAALGDAPR